MITLTMTKIPSQFCAEKGIKIWKKLNRNKAIKIVNSFFIYQIFCLDEHPKAWKTIEMTVTVSHLNVIIVSPYIAMLCYQVIVGFDVASGVGWPTAWVENMPLCAVQVPAKCRVSISHQVKSRVTAVNFQHVYSPRSKRLQIWAYYVTS